MKIALSITKLFLFSIALAVVFGNFAYVALTLCLLSLPQLLFKGKRVTGIFCIDLGTIASGVGTATAINVQYCPQVLFWIQTAAVDVNIRVLGDGTTYDIPAAGIAETGVIRQQGRFTNAYVLSIANGLLLNKTTTITITNQVASAFTLYGWSERPGDSYIKGISQVCIAQSGIDFKGFMFLSFPGAGATDQFNCTFKSGVNQQWRREELRARMQRFQNVINSAGYDLDDFDTAIQKLNFIPAAQQTAYILQKVRAKGDAASNALVAQAG